MVQLRVAGIPSALYFMCQREKKKKKGKKRNRRRVYDPYIQWKHFLAFDYPADPITFTCSLLILADRVSAWTAGYVVISGKWLWTVGGLGKEGGSNPAIRANVINYVFYFYI